MAALPPAIAKLKCVHPLTPFDQCATRGDYVRRMLIFDFPDQSEPAIEKAVDYIQRGLDTALTKYPFLTGRLGPELDRALDRIQLRYGDTDDLRKIAILDIFKVARHKEDIEHGSYDELCKKGMPASHWKCSEFCAAPYESNIADWPHVFTLQANFLEDGALVLYFAFQHSVVDGPSIVLFLEALADSCRFPKTRGEYKAPDLSDIFSPVETFMGEEFRFPEWDFDDGNDKLLACQAAGFLSTRIFTIPATKVDELKTVLDAQIAKYSQASQPSSTQVSISDQDALCALFWHYITHTRRGRPGFPKLDCVFSSAVDARTKVDIPEYFGNMSVDIVAERPSQFFFDPNWWPPYLPASKLANLAFRTRHKIEETKYLHIEARHSAREQLAEPSRADEAHRRAVLCTTSGIMFESLADGGADLDFGIPGTGDDGRARWIRKPWLKDQSVINILPRRGGAEGKADWEVMVCLRTDEMGELCHKTFGIAGDWTSQYVDDNDPSIYVDMKRITHPRRKRHAVFV